MARWVKVNEGTNDSINQPINKGIGGVSVPGGQIAGQPANVLGAQ